MKARQTSISIKGIQIAAQEWGPSDGEPLLALHGALDNSASYEPIAPLLLDQNNALRIVAVDLPGHGLSGHWPDYSHYHLWAVVEDIEHIADALGWDAFHLMGHSMGAAVSALYAGTIPKRLRSLTLIEALGPLPGTLNEVPNRLAEAILKMKTYSSKQSVRHSREAFIEARMDGLTKVTYESAQKIIERSVVEAEDGFAWSNDKRVMFPSMMRLPEEVILSFLRKISCPVLGIFADDALFNPKNIESRWGAINAPKQLHWRSGGHHLHMEGDVDALASDIGQFLMGI